MCEGYIELCVKVMVIWSIFFVLSLCYYLWENILKKKLNMVIVGIFYLFDCLLYILCIDLIIIYYNNFG